MRGTFLDNSVTFQVEIEGESWRQGEQVSVNWSIEGDLATPDMGLALALIDLRKVKKDDPKGIQLLEEIPFNSEKKEYRQTFNLADNASIADGTWTYSIVCGNLSSPLTLKRLDLKTLPWTTIEETIKLIENFKRFKMKSIKNKKGLLDAKFTVPTSKEYGAVEGLNILFAREAETNSMLMNFHFKTKKLTYSGAGVETTKDTIKIERLIPKSDYLIFGDSLNQEKLLNIFDEVFSEVSQRTRL
jgi:hypothetical protein